MEWKSNEYNVIREVVDGEATYVTIFDTRNERTRFRELLKGV